MCFLSVHFFSTLHPVCCSASVVLVVRESSSSLLKECFGSFTSWSTSIGCDYVQYVRSWIRSSRCMCQSSRWSLQAPLSAGGGDEGGPPRCGQDRVRRTGSGEVSLDWPASRARAGPRPTRAERLRVCSDHSLGVFWIGSPLLKH